MASQPIASSESFTAFDPELEHLIPEVMEERKVPGLAVAVAQNGEVAFVRPYGLRDVEADLKVTIDGREVVHHHGLGPFGGRAAHGLEEAGAGIHPGIPAASARVADRRAAKSNRDAAIRNGGKANRATPPCPTRWRGTPACALSSGLLA